MLMGNRISEKPVTPNPDVDYDRIAPSYNQRFKDGGTRGTASALRSLAQENNARRILEAGCGTGHWLAGMQSVPAHLYGLDLSSGMLRQAQQRQVPYALVRGRAGQLPFAGDVVDLVTCVNAIHHFQWQQAFVLEAHRLLRPGGALAVVGTDPRAHRQRWYIYDYFAGTYETDLARFPSWGTILDWMAEAGFERIEWRPVEQIVDHKIGRAVLADPFLQKEACSQLALLTDQAYAEGMGRIDAALTAAEAEGRTLTFQTDLFLAALIGWV
jgi:ubiquinone/menaquinone biosynthesis C-methylase UbiE